MEGQCYCQHVHGKRDEDAMHSAKASEFVQLAITLLEAAFTGAVEFGHVKVGSASAEDIVVDVLSHLGGWSLDSQGDASSNSPHFRTVLDHRDDLFENARRAAADGDDSVAIVLYATWFEHSINALLIVALRRTAIPDSLISLIVKKFNWREKISQLWPIVDLEPLSPENLKTANHVMDMRNEFVHYKWKAGDEKAINDHVAMLRERVRQVDALQSGLTQISEDFLWDGRREEILAAFRSHLNRVFAHPEDTYSKVLANLAARFSDDATM